jgi:hypothetical protein
MSGHKLEMAIGYLICIRKSFGNSIHHLSTTEEQSITCALNPHHLICAKYIPGEDLS